MGLRIPRFRRPAFSILLVTLVALVAGLTAAVLGGVAWREKRAAARALTDVAMTEVATLAATHAGRFFADTEPAARLGPVLVAQGLLDPADTPGLERYLLAVLRSHPSLTWASYGDRDGRFVGAWRDRTGATYVNRSFPSGTRIRLEEERVLDDRRRETVRVSDDHRYVPAEQPFFRLAEARRGLAWTDPYRFWEGVMGITCAVPHFDGNGVRGVFTVDLSLERLTGMVEALRITPRSRVSIATADGALMAGGAGPALGEPGERVLSHTASFDVGERRWRLAVHVPERDFTAGIDAEARRAALLAGVGLVVSAGAGVALARWIASPLRALGVQAQRVRDGDLAVDIVAESRDEIGTLAHAMADMVQGLRDRDFIRDVLGRYVSPDVATQCLTDRDKLQLGGELRTVSILMSDLRGFSALSERLGPPTMIELLNRYFGCMVPIILQHGGTINEFIGDAILVLFGAPAGHPDDAERAVRCAWSMQRAMVAFNAESRAAGLPALTMGIGLHEGRVVAGNIGTRDRVKYGVVGPAVNLVARIESLTLGPQTLLTEAMVGRVSTVARVGPPRPVQLKGIAEPVVVYELRGLVDEEDQPTVRPLSMAAVDLLAACYAVDGKQLREPAHAVRITRLGPSGVEFEAGPDFPDDAFDLKLMIQFADGATTEGSYARTASRQRRASTQPATIHVSAVFTALSERDGARIAAITGHYDETPTLP
jgi:class 3 adenylate cyclase